MFVFLSSRPNFLNWESFIISLSRLLALDKYCGMNEFFCDSFFFLTLEANFGSDTTLELRHYDTQCSLPKTTSQSVTVLSYGTFLAIKELLINNKLATSGCDFWNVAILKGKNSSFSFFIFGPSSVEAQRLFLVLYSRWPVMVFWRFHMWHQGIKSESKGCKARTLTPVLNFWPREFNFNLASGS